MYIITSFQMISYNSLGMKQTITSKLMPYIQVKVLYYLGLGGGENRMKIVNNITTTKEIYPGVPKGLQVCRMVPG